MRREALEDLPLLHQNRILDFFLKLRCLSTLASLLSSLRSCDAVSSRFFHSESADARFGATLFPRYSADSTGFDGRRALATPARGAGAFGERREKFNNKNAKNSESASLTRLHPERGPQASSVRVQAKIVVVP